MTEPEANDFLTHIIANETNKNHPELNITPDDPRVQEHVKKLEVILKETMKEYILPPDPYTLNKYIVAITNEASHSPEVFIGTGDTVEEARKAAKDKCEEGIK